MEQRFIATNKQVHTVIIAVWEDVCDLDKRLWNVAPFDPEASDEPQPLCIIEIITEYESPIYYKKIYSHRELMGVYV